MTTTELRNAIFKSIEMERKRQDEKWGVQTHDPATWLLIITEEVGEVAQAILKKDVGGYVKELVQVAASAIAALESHYKQHSILDEDIPEFCSRCNCAFQYSNCPACNGTATQPFCAEPCNYCDGSGTRQFCSCG